MLLLTLTGRRATAGFLCTGALTGALILGSTLQGCSSNVQPSTLAGTGGTGGAHAGASTASSGTGASTSAGTGGSGVAHAGTSTISSGTGGGTPASTSAGTGETGGAAASTSAATGGGDGGVPVVTVAQITDPTASGHVSNVDVKLTGLVATSSKFLVSKSKATGACAWGVFLSSPGLSVAAPHTAILAVNDGTPASSPDGGSGVYCPVVQAGQPAGDLFPDDTRPGDVFDIVGFAGSSLPTTCGAPDAAPPDNTDVGQYQLGELTSVTRTSVGGPVPAPHVLSAAEAHSLAAGQDATFFGAWGGARVEVDNVTAVLQLGMTFDPYGHMLMNDGVQVGDKLYYVGYVKATDVCYGGPVFASATPSFNAISGFVYLDYCTWGLSPADKCHDLSPPSDDCVRAADAGIDAGTSTVCPY